MYTDFRSIELEKRVKPWIDSEKTFNDLFLSFLPFFLKKTSWWKKLKSPRDRSKITREDKKRNPICALLTALSFRRLFLISLFPFLRDGNMPSLRATVTRKTCKYYKTLTPRYIGPRFETMYTTNVEVSRERERERERERVE